MKILLFVLALWAFMSIAPSDGKDVRRYYGKKGTICKKGHHWIVKIKCTNKCKIHKPKAAFESGGKVRITGRIGKAFRQKKKSCGRNCFCAKTSKPRWNQVFCKNHRGKKITSNRVHFDIWCIKRTTKLRFRAYVRNIGKPKMMEKKCPTGQNRHEDGVCRECPNKEYKDGTCKPCNCGVEGSKFQSCKTTSGKCNCKDEYKGDKCDQCKDKFYKPSGQQVCLACECNNVGTKDDGKCSATPAVYCNCKVEYSGAKCDGCTDAAKNKHEDGVCRKCDSGKYDDGAGNCLDCTCDANGAKFQSCEASTGFCTCKDGYKDKNCNNCQAKFYKPTGQQVCKACGCDQVGAGNSGKCTPNDGACTCKANFKPPKCTGCNEKFYYKSGSQSCEACGCDPDGSKNNGNCAEETGNCECKAEAKGAKCLECSADDHYRPSAGGACKPCGCVLGNTNGNDKTCDRDGKCNCAVGFTANDCSA